jgi:hypothetical protein
MHILDTRRKEENKFLQKILKKSFQLRRQYLDIAVKKCYNNLIIFTHGFLHANLGKLLKKRTLYQEITLPNEILL